MSDLSWWRVALGQDALRVGIPNFSSKRIGAEEDEIGCRRYPLLSREAAVH
jgi:hypothetical protein